jgi:DNA-binding transcriptional MocR family regulator
MVRHCVSCPKPSRPEKAISRSNHSKVAREKKAASCQNDDMATSTRIGSRALAALLPDLTSPGARPGAGPGARSGARRGAVYAALAEALSSLVLDGRIAVGTRVPSERELSAALGLSRTTVTAAYSALRADGYLISRAGSGSFTAVPPGSRASSSTARWAPPTAPPPDLIDLTCATPAGPATAIADAVAAAAAHLPWLTAGGGYDPVGVPRLREAIAARFAARGVPTDASQILITNGALHALDLLLRLLAASGGRVLTELPTYSGAIDAIRASAARLLPVPLAPGGGWDVEALQAALRQNAPGLAYLIPDFHNPTGALTPDAERRAVLRAARRAGTTVIVDETFVDLGFTDPATPAAAIDPSVVTIGSLSKTVWGGLRIGWIRAQADLIQQVAALRAATDMGGALLDQLVAVELVGRLDELAATRVAEVRPRRDALLAALARELPGWRVSAPQGGLSLWAELDAPLSTPLSVLARSAGVQIVPGSRFGADGTLERYVRLPYTQPAEVLERAVTRLREVWTALDRSSPAARPLVVA